MILPCRRADGPQQSRCSSRLQGVRVAQCRPACQHVRVVLGCIAMRPALVLGHLPDRAV